MKKSIIVLSMLISGASYAGCNPCICGPDGSFQGDRTQWWLDNCGHLPPKAKAVLCYNKIEDKIEKILDLNLAINSEELTACSIFGNIEK